MTQGMMMLAVTVGTTKRLMHVLAPDQYILKTLDPFANKGWSALSREKCISVIETWFAGDGHHESLCTSSEATGLKQNLGQT